MVVSIASPGTSFCKQPRVYRGEIPYNRAFNFFFASVDALHVQTNVQDNDDAEHLHFDKLRRVGDYLHVRRNTKLKSFSVSSLEHLDNDLYLEVVIFLDICRVTPLFHSGNSVKNAEK